LILLIDSGNTRTKWVLADYGQFLSEVGSVLNEGVESSDLLNVAKQATHVYVANVAGELMQTRLMALLGNIAMTFVRTSEAACGVINQYQQVSRLGVDRWLSMLAAHEICKTSCLVVNAGTALTIDALSYNKEQQNTQFIGGVIVPGLRLMQQALNANTAQLPKADGVFEPFAKNTADAIQTGCMLALLGAIQLQWQNLYDVVKTTPQILISGGDALVLKNNLAIDLAKHSIIVDNLVLRGLMRLERDM
jgi:type III pantothenate kinase